MLVLSRKHDESIVIGSNVHITVLAVQGNRVRLGITAPQDVAIRRAELDKRTDLPSVTLIEMRDPTSPQDRVDIVGP